MFIRRSLAFILIRILKMKNRSITKSNPSEETNTATKKKKKPNLTIKIPGAKQRYFLLHVRTSNDKLVINKNKTFPYKTAMLIDRDKVPPGSTFNDSDQLTQIPSNRPVANIHRKTRINSPAAVMTPKGTVLPRVARFGVMSLFSNEPTATPIIELSQKNKLNNPAIFHSSVPFKSITEPKAIEKSAQATITHKKLEKRRAEDIENHFIRSIEQNKVMAKNHVSRRKASATNYVNATTLFEKDLRWEWLHLVGHMIDGANSQSKNNLVAGTAFANTEMMFAEENLIYLASIYPNGFKLVAKAHLIPETHIATSIQYVIKTPDFEIPFEFNAQTKNKPHFNYKYYFDYLAKELVRTCKSKKINKTNNTSSIITYTKKEIADSDIPFYKDAITYNTSANTKPANRLKK